jgi:hypothetical protein
LRFKEITAGPVRERKNRRWRRQREELLLLLQLITLEESLRFDIHKYEEIKP